MRGVFQRACRFCSRPPSPGAFHLADPAPRSASPPRPDAATRPERKLVTPRPTTSAGYGKRSVQVAPPHAVFAPTDPSTTRSAKSSDSPQ